MAASTTAPAKQEAKPQKSSPKRFLARRWWLIAALILIGLLLIDIALLLFNWPFTEQAVIDVLQERSVRSVTINRFYKTYWPPGCVAESISFLHRKHKNKPPLITIQKLVIKGNYAGLLTISRNLSKVVVVGMHVTVPPPEPNGGPNPVMPLTESKKAGPSMVIGTVVADGTILDFLPSEPGNKPFRLMIDKLALNGVGNNKPLSYRTVISNTVPPGKIRSSGVFGTWNAENPASTPVNGSYTFQDANLAYFSDLSGTLFSSGKFTGTLGRMEVVGTAGVPNFHLTDTGHTTKLSTEFQAAVNATNGDTTLENVTAHLDQTTVLFKGSVSGQPGEKGKTVSLDIFEPHGRIEDLLDLFIAAKRAPMTGTVTFRAHAEVPPAPEDFVKKLKMTGDFGVDAGKFTDRETQASINRLSEGSTKNKKGEQEDAETALSDLKGHAVVDNGIATLSHVSFRVPGATAWMHGTYGLYDPYKVDLHGHLLTDKPSSATTGFKSFLLKALTPFLRKKGKERIVPFKITGTYQKTQTGLDLDSKK